VGNSAPKVISSVQELRMLGTVLTGIVVTQTQGALICKVLILITLNWADKCAEAIQYYNDHAVGGAITTILLAKKRS